MVKFWLSVDSILSAMSFSGAAVSGLHPRTVTVPPVLPPLALELVPGLSLPPPHAAASSATEATPATMVTVRVVPRIDVLLLKGSAVLNRTDRSGLLTGWSAAL